MSERSWASLTSQLIDGKNLLAADTAWAMDQVMSGSTSDVSLASFLVALAAKGETVPELEGFADAMLHHARQISISTDAVDIVGTGGDRHFSVNISTMAALVVAGAGVKVVKHGNRASTSKSGSADVLGALGVNLDLTPEQVVDVAERARITFLFAQVFHPAFRHAGPARKALGLPTAFNVLGPLTNPARPRSAAIGVGNERMAPLVAGVFANRKVSALVFRSDDGLDELSTTSPASVWEVADSRVTHHRIDFVRDLGFKAATLDDIRGGSPEFNAQAVTDLLAGKHSAIRDVVVINAAAGLIAAGQYHAESLTEDGVASTSDQANSLPLIEKFSSAIQRAQEAIDSGRSATVLQNWVDASNSYR